MMADSNTPRQPCRLLGRSTTLFLGRTAVCFAEADHSSYGRAWHVSLRSLQLFIESHWLTSTRTPVLPGFAGFVPRAISRIAPNASFVNGSNWEAFPVALTNTTFLEPNDPLFYTLQKKIVQKQQVAYGNVSHFYTIDSFNENVSQGNFSWVSYQADGTW